MAGENYYHIVVVLVAVLVAASPLLVQGQTLALNLQTRVCCSPSGNCGDGAGGLANVTGILRCLDPVTRILTDVGRGISSANGTLTITAAPVNPVASLLTGLGVGGVAPCVFIETFQLVNQTSCPVIDVATTLVGMTTVGRTLPSVATLRNSLDLAATYLRKIGACIANIN